MKSFFVSKKCSATVVDSALQSIYRKIEAEGNVPVGYTITPLSPELVLVLVEYVSMSDD